MKQNEKSGWRKQADEAEEGKTRIASARGQAAEGKANVMMKVWERWNRDERESAPCIRLGLLCQVPLVWLILQCCCMSLVHVFLYTSLHLCTCRWVCMWVCIWVCVRTAVFITHQLMWHPPHSQVVGTQSSSTAATATSLKFQLRKGSSLTSTEQTSGLKVTRAMGNLFPLSLSVSVSLWVYLSVFISHTVSTHESCNTCTSCPLTLNFHNLFGFTAR